MKISVHTVITLLHTIIRPVSADLVEHMQRTALTAWYLAKYSGLEESECARTYLAGMLHDIGALGKSRDKLALASEAFLDNHEAMGEAMVAGITFLQPIAPVLRHHHVHWQPEGVNPYPLTHYIVHMADEFELFLRGVEGGYLSQRERILNQFLERDVHWPPVLVDALCQAGQMDGFWFRLAHKPLDDVLGMVSPLKETYLGTADFLQLCQLISQIVDRYSSFTMTHSASVARVAGELARLHGYSENRQQKIVIAGYLHDIGKLFIPPEILEKQGRLTREEYDRIKLHSYQTRVMLTPVEGLQQVAYWASNHHERLDGSGYPFGLNAQQLDDPSRILAVADMYTALTENRPYRQGMDKGAALSILHEEVSKNKLAGNIVALLENNIEAVAPLVAGSAWCLSAIRNVA